MSNTQPIDKSILFPPSNEYGYASTWNMEDFLTDSFVFLAGFGATKRRSHCDAYGTIVDFAALDVAYNLLVQQYHPTKQEWSGLLKTWTEGANTQIPLKLVAVVIRHKLAKDNLNVTIKEIDKTKRIG